MGARDLDSADALSRDGDGWPATPTWPTVIGALVV